MKVTEMLQKIIDTRNNNDHEGFIQFFDSLEFEEIMKLKIFADTLSKDLQKIALKKV